MTAIRMLSYSVLRVAEVIDIFIASEKVVNDCTDNVMCGKEQEHVTPRVCRIVDVATNRNCKESSNTRGSVSHTNYCSYSQLIP